MKRPDKKPVLNIENCAFEYRCPKEWDALVKTADEKIRYCSVCDKGVHFCRTNVEIEEAKEKRWCVAIEQLVPSQTMILGELTSPYSKAQEHDQYELRQTTDSQPLSLDEILNDDDLLATPSDTIFNLVHTQRPTVSKSDKVSSRRLCEDFENFKPLFDQCVAEIGSGKRSAVKFANEQEIKAGEFFVLNGIMAYVAEVGETHTRNGKKNARLRLIFDNGQEGHNLLRSLATELYKDPNGRRIISLDDAGPLFADKPVSGDTQTGTIYVLRSLSDDPEIRRLDGTLHKIGFTARKVKQRIKKAKNDPTFLMAPVHPVATYELYNIDKVKMEHLLHHVFASSRLDIEITDRFGKKVKPREWFLVTSDTISQAISMLQDGSIVNYRYDRESAKFI